LTITNKTFCIFRGHVYSRFERRKKPTCVCCGPSRERYIDRRVPIGKDTRQRIHQEHLRPSFLGRFVSAVHRIHLRLPKRGGVASLDQVLVVQESPGNEMTTDCRVNGRERIR
jgi:hypothetical protein